MYPGISIYYQLVIVSRWQETHVRSRIIAIPTPYKLHDCVAKLWTNAGAKSLTDSLIASTESNSIIDEGGSPPMNMSGL